MQQSNLGDGGGGGGGGGLTAGGRLCLRGDMGVQRCRGGGGGASVGRRRRWRLPTRRALAAALAAARQRDYGGGAVGAVVAGCSDVGCGVGGGGVQFVCKKNSDSFLQA